MTGQQDILTKNIFPNAGMIIPLGLHLGAKITKSYGLITQTFIQDLNSNQLTGHHFMIFKANGYSKVSYWEKNIKYPICWSKNIEWRCEHFKGSLLSKAFKPFSVKSYLWPKTFHMTHNWSLK